MAEKILFLTGKLAERQLKRILEAIMKAVKHIHKKMKFRQSKAKFL